MESRLAALKRKGARGQVLPYVALALAFLVMVAAFALSYATLSIRVIHVTAIADTAAHAGAMEVRVLPNGKILPSSHAVSTVRRVFYEQAPPYATLQGVQCGLLPTKEPYCDVVVSVRSKFLLAAHSTVRVRSVLAYGVTRSKQ